MTPLDQSLALVEQAEQLQQQIIQALTDGDSAQAEALSHAHRQVIESIPFAQFSAELPGELLEALQRLQRGNDKLSALTETIQHEIGEQLNRVQRGISGSQVYQDIDSHQ